MRDVRLPPKKDKQLTDLSAITTTSSLQFPEIPKKDNSGKLLGIVSFILSIISLGLIGLILGIIALGKSKKAHLSNVFATLGTLIGVLNIVVSCCVLYFIIVFGNGNIENHIIAVGKCALSGESGIVVVHDSIFQCKGIGVIKVGNKLNPSAGGIQYSQ